MKYVNPCGFEQYVGGEAFTAIADRLGERLEGELERVERRLLAYIIPNAPVCDEQIGAFSRAVYAQMEYEQSEAGMQLADVPNGVQSFSVNGFSATFGGRKSEFFNAGLCSSARAELLYAGLLYRGVDCRC